MGLVALGTLGLMIAQHGMYIAHGNQGDGFLFKVVTGDDTILRFKKKVAEAKLIIENLKGMIEEMKRHRKINSGFEVNSQRDKARPKTDHVTDGDWEIKAGSVQLGAFDKHPHIYVRAVSTGSSKEGTIVVRADDWTSIQGGKHGVDIRSNDPGGDIDIGDREMTSGCIKLRHGLQQVVLDKTSLKAEKFKDVEISALGSITLKVGKSQIRLEPQGVTIQGPIIKVQATGPAQVEGKTVLIKSQGPGPVRIDSALPVGGILIG
jgi:hypothetical protein